MNSIFGGLAGNAAAAVGKDILNEHSLNPGILNLSRIGSLPYLGGHNPVDNL
jgi:hypothetical protein